MGKATVLAGPPPTSHEAMAGRSVPRAALVCVACQCAAMPWAMHTHICMAARLFCACMVHACAPCAHISACICMAGAGAAVSAIGAPRTVAVLAAGAAVVALSVRGVVAGVGADQPGCVRWRRW